MSRPTTREWQPGDVAIVASMYGREVVAVRCGVPSNMGWAYADHLNGAFGNCWSSDPGGLHVVRPLVVIDPEDRDQVERLYQLLREQNDTYDDDTPDELRAALISFVADPKPDEPTGLGAVVEDVDGDRWVRVNQKTGTDEWRSCGFLDEYRRFADIDAARVLSEGVSA